MIKKTVAPERGSHCTLRADLCVFPRTWVHGVQFLLVRVDLRTRLTAHQQIKTKNGSFLSGHTEGWGYSHS